MSLRQLFPDAEPDLPGLYAYPDRRWLRANMVATADGVLGAIHPPKEEVEIRDHAVVVLRSAD